MASRDGGGSPPDHVEDEHSETSDSVSGSSYAGSAGSAPDSPACPYRTSQFFDQECSVFFDCPTHILPRLPLTTGNATDNHGEATAESTGSHTLADATRTPENLTSTVPDTADGSTAHQVPEELSTSGQTPTPQHGQQVQIPIAQSAVVEGLARQSSSITTLEGDSQGTQPSLQSSPPGNSGASSSAPNLRPTSSHSSLRGNLPDLRSDPPSQSNLAAQSSPPSQVPPQLRPRPRPHPSEYSLPRWQPDAEVTYCPICHTQFSIFVRKHHCRKCGRVVCANCSPHRIIIPHQYIVRPPSDAPRSSGIWGEERSPSSLGGVPGGGERVRLCNPCVPDPNTTPPHALNSPNSSHFGPRPGHQRAQSNADRASQFQPGSLTGQYPGFNPTSLVPALRDETLPRSRSVTVNSNSLFSRPQGPFLPGPSQSRSSHFISQPNDLRIQVGTSDTSPVYIPAPHYSSSSGHQQSSQYGQPYYYNTPALGGRRTYASRPGASSSSSAITSAINDRPLPPRPQIPEEDECPVCHQELPSRSLSNFEALREAHVRACIASHSSYSPQPAVSGEAGLNGTPPLRVARRTGMFPYVATEKDCVDSAECTICFEEYEVGVAMARLECLCRFHRACISAWFVKNPGRCPVHQHDSFGY